MFCYKKEISFTRKTRAGCDKDFRKPGDPEKAHENFQLGSGYEISEHEFVVLLTNQSSQKYKANCYAKNSDCFKNRLLLKINLKVYYHRYKGLTIRFTLLVMVSWFKFYILDDLVN